MKTRKTQYEGFTNRSSYVIVILGYLIIVLTVLSTMLSCSYDSEDDLVDAPIAEDPNNGDPASLINYNDDIKPILQSSCVGCHASPPTNGAPFALVNFTQVMQRGEAIFNAMNRQSGTPAAMPPSGRLPQTTIDVIREWIDNGSPEN